MIAETYREGQLRMGIYPVEEDRKTFRAEFSRMDGLSIDLPLEGKYSFIYGLLHAEPGSWTWDIAEILRRSRVGKSLVLKSFRKSIDVVPPFLLVWCLSRSNRHTGVLGHPPLQHVQALMLLHSHHN